MRFLGTLLAFWVLLAGLTGPAWALDVNALRFGQHPDKVRLVLELSGPAAFRAVAMGGPDRLVIDLPDYEWRVGDLNLRGINNVNAVRQGPLQPGINRIVLDMNRPVSIINAFIIPATQGLPDRLVVDFKNASAADPGRIFGSLRTGDAPAPSIAAAPVPPRPAANNDTQVLGTLPIPRPLPAARQNQEQNPPQSVPEQMFERAVAGTNETIRPARKPSPSAAAPAPVMADGRKPVIVIDAGHGGVDPGAIGTNGVFEKHVTLAMAKELKQQLEGSGRYTVYLTRDSDKFLRLYQRVDIARQRKADLFISLHADTIGKGNVRGVSIYTLSETASDKETAELAERENKVDLIAGADLSHTDKDIAQILVGMSMRDTMNQSKFFANTAVDNLKGDGLRLLERPHRFAGFAVLKAPDVPSVLVEIGFMSNKDEARLLNDPAHRHKLGSALARSIDAYFEKVRRNSRT
jgi:N-acetylmuramoyl-L-alanine amidase